MTRINTNVSSINAQKTLARSNASLQESLSRLSTGLRINAGKDDPAGLIASEVLRADIISVERAITNSKRANQMIATADSALGQVSSLLNDIRGLVSEAANTGAMSAEQIAANQLQVDSSLEAIDRIAQTTQFQGKRLLDGNLDFLTQGVKSSELQDVQIDQANFGSLSQIDVNVEVVTQATRASLNYAQGAISQDVVLEVGGKNGFEAFSFAAGSTIADMAKSINLVSDALGVTAQVQTEATAGSINVSSFGADNDIVLTAKTAGFDAGNIRVKFTADPTGNATLAANYTRASGSDPGTLEIALETEAWVAAEYTIGATDAVANNAMVITAKEKGTDFNDWTFVLASTAGAAGVTFNTGTKTITIDDGTNGGASGGSANSYKTIMDNNAQFAAMFSVNTATADGGDGTGNVTTGTFGHATYQTTEGVDGGTILSTANDVVTLINNTSVLKDDVVASLATSNDGHEALTAFQESAYYGSATANNGLQFLGAQGAANIRFVATAGNSLGVDLSTDPKVEGFASAVINLGADQSTIAITARNKGGDYDDVTIKFAADTNAGAGAGVATWDAQNKEITIFADQGADTVADILGYINNSAVVKDYFRASSYGTTDTTAVATALTDGKTVGTTSGGLVSSGTVIVNLETDANGVIKTTAQDLIDYFDDTANAATLAALGISVSNLEGSDGSGLLGATTSDLTFATTGTTTSDSNASATLNTSGGINSMLTITADIAGAAYDGVKIQFEGTAAAKGSETVAYDAITKTLTIGIVDGVSQASDVLAAINNDAVVKELFTAAYTQDVYGGTTDSDGSGLMYITDNGTMSGGTTTTGTATGTALLGNADEANTGLTFNATEYGSDAFVSIKTLNGASFEVKDSDGNVTDRKAGTDVDALINGVRALGKGLKATINTSALDISFSVSTSMIDGSTSSFAIVGGGATFQLGPDVVSNQQARLGISSVNTAKLGGLSGRLYELRSGNAASLENDVIRAAAIVEETITSVVNLRGRLGAFQRTTLDTNIASMEDTLENLTAAESDIRDADFAEESAKLTRNQILVQSGISVLSMANQNPQSVLSLLR
jgi:flagellin-like hook-associated protein FlgL